MQVVRFAANREDQKSILKYGTKCLTGHVRHIIIILLLMYLKYINFSIIPLIINKLQ